MAPTRSADRAPLPAMPDDAEQLGRALETLRREHAALRRKLEKVVSISDMYAEQLRCARRDLKQLRDLFLPICMYCKRVRTDDSYWEKIERYFARHAAVSFSHGICPTCMEERFGPVHPTQPQAEEPPPAAASPPTQGPGVEREPAIQELSRLLEDPQIAAAPSAAALRRAVTRCERAMARYRKVVEISDGYQEEYQARLERAVRQDPLTGLASRAAAVQALEEASNGGEARGAALMIVAVRGLVAVNETYGYGAGDRLLIALARALRVSASRALLRARWSGAQFAVLLAAEDVPQAVKNVERALGTVVVEDDGHRLGAEIRAGLVPRRPGLSAAAWVAAAERAARG